jgi:uncharacterized protein (DUF433 family)
MSQANQCEHIELRAGARGMRAFVAGHRVRVQDIALWNEEGLSADEIVARVPSITLADVHAALSYYYDNREEIDRQIDEDDAFASEVKKTDLSR